METMSPNESLETDVKNLQSALLLAAKEANLSGVSRSGSTVIVINSTDSP